MCEWCPDYTHKWCSTHGCVVDTLGRCLSFLVGFYIGHLYYTYLLQGIPFPGGYGSLVGVGLPFVLGILSVLCSQMRCICLLVVPMYCGKPGRGVLKVLVLTYVIAGPITNMGLNAKEVVRVFACSTRLAHNLSRTKHSLMATPFRGAMFGLRGDIAQVNDTLSAFGAVVQPIEREVEDMAETPRSRQAGDVIDDIVGGQRRSVNIENKYKIEKKDTEDERYQKMYLKKVEYRCQDELSRAVALCVTTFKDSYDACVEKLPKYAGAVVCWPMRITYICNVMQVIAGNDICDTRKQIDPGIGAGYVYLQRAKREMVHTVNDVTLQYHVNYVRQLDNVQDAKETGELVVHAFEKKEVIMRTVITIVNIVIAILFLRIFTTAVAYHETYLTRIDHDNVYVTGYFKDIDRRRRDKGKYYLLPLKKMERRKYTDVCRPPALVSRARLLSQGLKVLLEVVTATTFVLLDRMFYEALDVVRQHARVDVTQQGAHDLEIKVDGKGLLATLVRKILSGVNSNARVNRTVSNEECLPQPRLMPTHYFVNIYGGYLWILLLLFFNPYTLRLSRLISSYFYPAREKQRILHLYNDILKKRMKMQKTLRKIAVQSVRAYYLSGENLLSLSMKYPQIFGWLRMFPAARMTCLICGETQPTNSQYIEDDWQSCSSCKCPFVYCGECWREIGERCLACDPSLADLSDIHSLSDDDQFRY